MIRVYLAEDSPTVGLLLKRMLEGAPDIVVVGWGRDGLQAQADLRSLRPDVLVTDLNMPRMNGYQLIEWAMAEQPLPIVVLSDSLDSGDREVAMRCLRLGAMEARAKPWASPTREFSTQREMFQGLVRALGQVKRIRRVPAPTVPTQVAPIPANRPVRLLAIGASTGGPQAVVDLLSALDPKVGIPAILAVHMEAGFMKELGRWLTASTGWSIRLGAEGEEAQPGILYLPAEGRHITLTQGSRLGSLAAEGGERLVPGVDRLFLSVADVCGPTAAAVLLTGMGRDGALGLKAIRDRGGFTLAQDEASCVVYGMPKAALEQGAALASLPPGAMAEAILHAVRGGRA